MTDLNFYDSLRIHPFSGRANNYSFNIQTATNFRFSKYSTHLPFIFKSGYFRDKTEMSFCIGEQFGGRLLNTDRIKEILNSSPLPIVINIGGKNYLMGKGFLAHAESLVEYSDSINLLFVACNAAKRVETMEDVSFYVSRDVYNEEYKAVLPAIKNILAAHRGNIITTNNIAGIITDKIPFPAGGTLKDRQEYNKKIMLECIKDSIY